METGIIIFFNSESHSFFVDPQTSLSSLKEHVVQSFGLDKDAQLVLKTLDESLTLFSDEDLRSICSQIDADDFVLLSAFVLEPAPVSVPSESSSSSSSLNVEAEEPKEEEKQEECLEFPAFVQDVMRQFKLDPQVTKKKAERAIHKINAKCPGLITSDTVRHLNGLLNQLSSNLEKNKTEINDLADSLDRSSSSSSSCEGAVPPSFHPFFHRLRGEAMRRCRKNREDHAEEPKSTESQTPSSSSRSPHQMHPAMCDNCSTMIEGVRFKCTVCPDFDLCSKCEDSDNKHNPDHLFVKMKRPVDAIHFNNHRNQENVSTTLPAFPHCPAFGRRGGHWGRKEQAGPHFFGGFSPCHPGFGPAPETRPFCPRDAPASGPHAWWRERKNLHERVETLEKTLASLEAKLDRL